MNSKQKAKKFADLKKKVTKSKSQKKKKQRLFL